MKKIIRVIFFLSLAINGSFLFGSHNYYAIVGHNNNVHINDSKHTGVNVCGDNNNVHIGIKLLSNSEEPIKNANQHIISWSFFFIDTMWLHSIARNMSNFSWQYWVASAALLYYIPSEKKSVTLCGSLLLTLYVAWPSRNN